MKIIDYSTNLKYSQFKIYSAIGISLVYMWQIYMYNPTSDTQLILFVFFNVIVFLIAMNQRKYSHKVIKPLLFNEKNSEEYKTDLMKYVSKVNLAINVEYIMIIFNLLLGLFGELSPFYYLQNVHNHQFLPMTLLVAGVVYLFSFESDIDYVYLKYFRDDYLNYMKKYYK